MKIEKLIEKHKILLSDNSIITAYRGSITFGTYVPNSNPNSVDDKDIISVIVPDISYYLGINSQTIRSFPSNGTKEFWEEEYDVVVYEYRKFVNLLLQCNPNVISLLWIDSKYYIKLNESGRMLIKIRDLFSTKEAYHRFIGYAHGQMHRMTSGDFNGYMGQKRKSLVEKFGYDTKNAAHLIRLMIMCIEFLTDGIMRVERQDATELLDIKNGKWSLEKVKLEAEELKKLAQEAYIRSPLPPKISDENLLKINDIVIHTILSKYNIGTSMDWEKLC